MEDFVHLDLWPYINFWLNVACIGLLIWCIFTINCIDKRVDIVLYGKTKETKNGDKKC